jgi:hypothetical protein
MIIQMSLLDVYIGDKECLGIISFHYSNDPLYKECLGLCLGGQNTHTSFLLRGAIKALVDAIKVFFLLELSHKNFMSNFSNLA